MVLTSSNEFQFISNELLALSRSRHPDTKSWQAVKEAILQAANYLREKTGQTSAPIKLTSIEKIRYIKEKITYDSESASGAILKPVSGGFILLLGKNQTTVRRRFSIAHEIGHTFFYNMEHDPPIKVLPIELAQLLGEKKEEDICNTFARELLIPNKLVENDIQNLRDRNLQIIVDLAAKYVVSPEVVARKLLLDLSEFQTSIVLFLEPIQTSNKSVWWFYGSTLRRYLRKEEEEIFKQIVSFTRERMVFPTMQQNFLSNKKVTMESYQSIPNTRAMALITFLREKRGEVSTV